MPLSWDLSPVSSWLHARAFLRDGHRGDLVLSGRPVGRNAMSLRCHASMMGKVGVALLQMTGASASPAPQGSLILLVGLLDTLWQGCEGPQLRTGRS